MTQIWLLTHERECERATNTGQIALATYPQWVKRVVWSRTQPDEALVELLSSNDPLLSAYLLFPAPDSDVAVGQTLDCETGVDDKHSVIEGEEDTFQYQAERPLPTHIVILDATWQEARKMLRQSLYLRSAKRISLPDVGASQFALRRNQIDGGLCTIECIIALCQIAGKTEEANTLAARYLQMNIGR